MKEKISQEMINQLVKEGTINILALGYEGVTMWRKHRDPIKNNTSKSDEKKA